MARGSRDTASPWLGGRAFRVALIAAVLVFAVFTFVRDRRFARLEREVEPGIAVVGSQLFTKDREEAYRVMVFNTRDATPLRDAPVRLLCARDFVDDEDEYREVVRTLARGTTDATGVAHFRVKLPHVCLPKKIANPAPGGEQWESPPTIVAEIDTFGVEQDDGVSTYRHAAATNALIATDKPVYQPGQTIRMRGLVIGEDRRPVGGAEIQLEVKDPKGNKVFKRQLTTSPFGNVHADLPLADQVNLGAYALSLTDGSVTTRHVVEVKRYALPKLDVTLAPASRSVAPGGTLRAALRARWMFGEPVTKAGVDLWFGSKDDSPPDDAVKARTDDTGSVEVDLPAPAEPGSVELAARVTAEGGDTRSVSVPVTVSGQEMSVDLVPDGGPLVDGVENQVFVLTSTPDGRPTRARVRIEPGGPDVVSSADGVARLRFVPASGQVLTATPTRSGTPRTIELSGQNAPSRGTVLVRTDRSSYEPGATIRVRAITDGDDGRTVALDLAKGRRVIATGSCLTDKGGCDVRLRLPEEVRGLVLVRASHFAEGRIGYASKFVLAGGGGGLSVDVESDKAVYRPSDSAKLTFTVHHEGRPKPAALSLAGVDEAVFALAESRPDLQQFFFGVGRDLAEAANTGTQTRYGWGRIRDDRRDNPPLAPDPKLLGGRTVELLSGERPSDLRDVLLAALAQKAPFPEGFDRSYEPMRNRSNDLSTALWEVRGRIAMLPGVLFLVTTLVLIAYGIRRARRGRIHASLSDADVAAWKSASRTLMVTWLLAFLAPMLAAIAVAFVLEAMLRIRGGFMEGAVLAAFSAGVLVPLFYQVRSLLRLRRSNVMRELPGFRQVAWLLPLSVVFAYAQILALVFFDYKYIRAVFDYDMKVAFALGVLGILAQLVFGALSVVRNTATEDTTVRRRTWLWLSRASFAGLPLALVAMGFVLADIADHAGGYSLETEQLAVASADNKEGGTGTRAKGEEGSMGRPRAAADEPASKARSHFPETLLWAPEVVTDESGRATVSVPLADSITTWRISASAISLDGQQGATTSGLRVMQDFFGDVSLPAELTQNDETDVPISVFNYLSRPQTVAVVIELPEGLEALGEAGATMEVGPGQVRGTSMRVRAKLPGTHKVRVRFQGPQLSDAVERTVRVEPDGRRVELALNGSLPERSRQTVVIPDNAVAGGSDLYLKVYGGLLSQLAEGLDGAFRRPYGCFEQTSSATYPNVLVLDYLRRSKVSSPEVEKKALGYIGSGLQRLVSFEVADGGFSLFGSAPASTMLTAYGLIEFHDMAHVYDVDSGLIARTRTWLYAQQDPQGRWTRAVASYLPKDTPVEWLRTTSYVAWAIAETGDRDPRLDKALDQIEGGDAPGADESYTLALRANALASAGRDRKAKALLEKLLPRARKASDGRYWTSDTMGISYSRGASMDVELTGLIVQAMAKLDAWAEERAQALMWIASQRDRRGTWHATPATVSAMRALLTQARPNVPGVQKVSVVVNGQSAGEVVIPEDERDVHRLLSLRPHVRTGENVVELRSSGQQLVYQVVAVHYVPWEDRARTGDPIALKVSYDRKAVEVGGVVRCRATLEWGRPEPAVMPMVELGVPPGFSAEDGDFAKLVQDGVIARYQVGGNRVVVYLDAVTKEAPVSFEYRLRAETPVRAAVPGSVAYPYYEPELRAVTEPVVLVVR